MHKMKLEYVLHTRFVISFFVSIFWYLGGASPSAFSGLMRSYAKRIPKSVSAPYFPLLLASSP